MKNFKHEKCKENRNYLKYIESNPFSEPPALTILKCINGKTFIKNKRENLDGENSVIFIESKHANKTAFIRVNISKDHLITAKISYKVSKEIKTRDMSEVIALINEVLFT